MIRTLLAVLVVLCALPAWAGTPSEYRVGVFVGNNHGRPSQGALMWARDDARKMRDLFVDYGGVAKEDAFLVEDGSRRAVEGAFVAARQRIATANAAGRPAVLLFYYSGHGDDEALQLGATTITHDDLRAWLEQSGARLRIAFLDACQSGSAVREKGGVAGPAYQFAVGFDQTRGTAILTSSASAEFSQESDALGGGFFTYYLHSALMGAADVNQDGTVTLPEAKSYVHGETSLNAATAAGPQTPQFEFELSGSGELVLTWLARADAGLEFPGGLEGTYQVFDLRRRRWVAEIDGSVPGRLALAPGTYAVERPMSGWVDEASYRLQSGEVLAVVADDFSMVPRELTAARGQLKKLARRRSFSNVQVRVAPFGGRGFGQGSVVGSQYLPTHPVGGLQARLQGARAPIRNFYAQADVLGGFSPGTLHFAQAGDRRVQVGSGSLGLAAGFSPRWDLPLLRLGVGAKTELIWFNRSFPDGDAKDQSLQGLAIGATAFLGLEYQRVSIDLVQLDWMMLMAQFDDRARNPVYGNLLVFSLGYRF